MAKPRPLKETMRRPVNYFQGGCGRAGFFSNCGCWLSESLGERTRGLWTNLPKASLKKNKKQSGPCRRTMRRDCGLKILQCRKLRDVQHWRYCRNCFAISHREQSSFSLRGVCRQPRAEFKRPRGVAPLTATGGHYPAPLCLLYGKRARITTRGGTGRLLYWAGLELETHSTQITQGTSAGTKGGLIRPGLGEVQRNSENESYQA